MISFPFVGLYHLLPSEINFGICYELDLFLDCFYVVLVQSFSQIHLSSTSCHREKNMEARDFLEAAKQCIPLCRSYGVPLLINDRVDIALACDADGVHVGQSDIPASVVRSLLGPEKIIGVSCKTPEQASQAWIDGADYIGCGGVFPTNTKANNQFIGLDGLKAVCLESKLPVVAIGGINMSNASSVMEIDAPNLAGVAVVSALFDNACVLSATQRLHAALKAAVSRT